MEDEVLAAVASAPKTTIASNGTPAETFEGLPIPLGVKINKRAVMVDGKLIDMPAKDQLPVG